MTTSQTETATAASPDYVSGVLNYLADKDQHPVSYNFKPPPGVPARTGAYAKFTVPIHNARTIMSELSLDKQGFAVTRQNTAVANFYDPEEVRRVYYPEVERMVREFTGAVKVHVFDHNVRSRPMAKRRENGAQEPVKVAHNDYTLKSGPQRVRDLIPEQADALLKNRFAVINVWRPIRGPVQESPLAVCDAQKHGAGRLRQARSQVPRSRGRGLLSRVQPEPSMVLRSESAKRRSAIAQVLRLRRAPRALHRAFRLRGSDQPA